MSSVLARIQIKARTQIKEAFPGTDFDRESVAWLRLRSGEGIWAMLMSAGASGIFVLALPRYTAYDNPPVQGEWDVECQPRWYMRDSIEYLEHWGFERDLGRGEG